MKHQTSTILNFGNTVSNLKYCISILRMFYFNKTQCLKLLQDSKKSTIQLCLNRYIHTACSAENYLIKLSKLIISAGVKLQ